MENTASFVDTLLGPSVAAEISVHALPEELRCGYTSKRCENPRTIKKSGGLHRFCAFHRERANKNQWRVDHRRRLLRKAGYQGTSPKQKSPRSVCASKRAAVFQGLCDEDIKCEITGDHFEPMDSSISPQLLSFEDASILSAMLFNDEEDTPSQAAETSAVEPCFTNFQPHCACHTCIASVHPLMYINAAVQVARQQRIAAYWHV
ncbi:hypothetical protein PINS_up022698 [Pythium insidiosum]|nr:hypothetical protein PINS_up004291 [Pythium insidiosum]GLE09958.1 hypothetical protein PINS_up021903 [Pythium insidiosum]GLE10552.1 hypothetical protein PINS_up022698 [Pythium insidiosum]